jgi:hypothetical protein
MSIVVYDDATTILEDVIFKLEFIKIFPVKNLND